jgi:hypothetical protein
MLEQEVNMSIHSYDLEQVDLCLCKSRLLLACVLCNCDFVT